MKQAQYVKLRNESNPFNGQNISFTLSGKEIKLLTPEALGNNSVNEALKPDGVLIPATEQEFVAIGGKV
jgi:hypothetical protein